MAEYQGKHFKKETPTVLPTWSVEERYDVNGDCDLRPLEERYDANGEWRSPETYWCGECNDRVRNPHSLERHRQPRLRPPRRFRSEPGEYVSPYTPTSSRGAWTHIDRYEQGGTGRQS